VTLAREESREIWGWLWAERLWQGLRYPLRGFGRSPGFTVVALLSLMLGIGARTALFSEVYGVLIAPYPYAKPDEIWAPAITGKKEPPEGWHPYPLREFLEIQKLPAFSDVMATGYEPMVVTGDRAPERFYGVLMTGGAFHFIGVKPLIGRTIESFDIGSGGEPAPVVVLSYGFWQRVFNGDPKAIGQKLILNKAPHTIIGVMPPRFGWYTNESFWLPMPMNLADETPLNVIMRLRSGITKQVAEQQLHALNLRLAAAKPDEFPKGKLRTVLLNYMDITVASGEMSSSLHLLLVAVGLLLLIACVNVANLQLARTTQEMDKELWFGRPRTLTEILGYQTVEPRFNMALFNCFAALGLALAGVGIYSVISYDVTQRMHEIGVRVALGATRADVLRLVLRTAAKLAALGLAIGLCGSVVVERIVRFQVFAATSFDARSMAGVVLTLAVVALAATWWPARRAARLDPVAALRHEA